MFLCSLVGRFFHFKVVRTVLAQIERRKIFVSLHIFHFCMVCADCCIAKELSFLNMFTNVLFMTLMHAVVVVHTQFVPPSKPNYVELEKYDGSQIHTHPEFITACKEMAGYYKDPMKNPALSKTILMGGINFSYRDFYFNFRCYTDRLGIKFLPISLDPSIYKYLTDKKVHLQTSVVFIMAFNSHRRLVQLSQCRTFLVD